MARLQRQRTTVFVSYSHRDARWLKRLQVHLKPYEREGRLELWDDSRIRPGDDWRAEIRLAMKRAAAAILLISPDFLASTFVAEEELPKLLAAEERSGARILPIIVEHCELRPHRRLSAFQALNPPDRPLAVMPRTSAEQVLVKAVEEIGNLLTPLAVASDRGTPRDIARAGAGAGASWRAEEDADELYDSLHAACVTSAILWRLGRAETQAFSIGELQKELRWRSRKTGVEALTALVDAGWVEKTYEGEATGFRLTERGMRQVRRLASTCDGPFAREMAPKAPEIPKGA